MTMSAKKEKTNAEQETIQPTPGPQFRLPLESASPSPPMNPVQGPTWASIGQRLVLSLVVILLQRCNDEEDEEESEGPIGKPMGKVATEQRPRSKPSTPKPSDRAEAHGR